MPTYPYNLNFTVTNNTNVEAIPLSGINEFTPAGICNSVPAHVCLRRTSRYAAFDTASRFSRRRRQLPGRSAARSLSMGLWGIR
jgi:hypothetical protein